MPVGGCTELLRGEGSSRTMTSMFVENGRHRYGFIHPTREMVRHVTENSENELEEIIFEAGYPGADDRDEGWWDDAEDVEPCYEQYSNRVWWQIDTACDGGGCMDGCDCGRVSLLYVLEKLPPEERGRAVALHAEEMRGLYEHFWAGQGLVSGAADAIGEACSSCLTEGAVHVWEIYENACELAEEFGEALAAYAYQLFVGEPRYPHP